MSDLDRIDAYLAAQPGANRALLAHVRDVVRTMCPDAVEVISYGMPGFRLHGRLLISYAGYKRHCALYPASGRVREVLGDALTPYLTEKATIRFAPDAPLPDDLLRRIVEARVAEVLGARG